MSRRTTCSRPTGIIRYGDSSNRLSHISERRSSGAEAASGDALVEVDPRYFRPTEVDQLLDDATKARNKLGWHHKTSFDQLVEADMIVVPKTGTAQPPQLRARMHSLSIIREVLQHHGNNLPRKVLRTWWEAGWRGLLTQSIDAFRLRPIDKFYPDWIRRYDALTEQGRQDIRDEVAEWNAPPLISLLMLICDPDDNWLEATLRSICA